MDTENLKKLIEEANKIVAEEGADLIWHGSECAACGESACLGNCPGYAKWEREFMANHKNKFHSEQELLLKRHVPTQIQRPTPPTG